MCSRFLYLCPGSSGYGYNRAICNKLFQSALFGGRSPSRYGRARRTKFLVVGYRPTVKHSLLSVANTSPEAKCSLFISMLWALPQRVLWPAGWKEVCYEKR
nr:MAG TPA: hypothetical protein [Caudoviricetes sp.]